ncbi:MAG: molybdopterin-dependent oxidoreductase [Anaerolineae bacterium]|nr:molybdopterin-dependent oxidoreductase [Anaerolineae bacterium]
MEKRVKAEGRLPPGQSITLKFPVLHYGPVPVYENLDAWDFKITGLVEEPVTLNWAQFTSLPTRNVTYDIHCVTRWSKFDTGWRGVHLQDMLAAGLFKLKPEARYVIQHCEFGFTVNLPLEAMLAENFIFAYEFDDQPLDPEHGYPLRGLMGALAGQHASTDRYLWKGGKWIRGIEFTVEDRAGFWEQAGYSMTANIWNEERFRRGF